MTSQYVQLYSLGAAPATDPFGVVKRLAEIGFTGVEPVMTTGTPPEMTAWIKSMGFPEMPRADVPSLKRALDEYGLTAPSAHGALPEGAPGDELLDELALLGTQHLIVAGLFDPAAGGPVSFDSRDQVQSYADRFSAAADSAASRGISIGYHNHSWELGTDFDGQTGLELFYDLTSPNVIAEIDVYWVVVGGQDPAAFIRRLGDRVQFLHVKDGDGQPDTPSSVLGEGTLDIPAVLAAAPEALRVIELEGLDQEAVWPVLEKSFAYLSDK